MSNPCLKLGAWRGICTGLAILASVTMFAVMGYHGAPLKEPTATQSQSLTPRGIVELELCWSAKRANEVLGSWKLQSSFRDSKVWLLDVAIEDTWLDFGFIVIYATAATLFCGYAATRPKYHLQRSTLIMLAWAQLAAGCLDVIENIGMLIMLYNGNVTSDLLPVVTTICAGTKFVMIVVGPLLGLGTIAFTAVVKSSRAANVGP